MKKNSRTTIPLDAPRSLSNDDYEIRVKRGDKRHDTQLVSSIDEDLLVVLRWDETDSELKEHSIDLCSLSSSDFQVRHYFNIWQFRFDDLFSAWKHEVLKKPLQHKLLQARFDRGLKPFDDRIELLKNLCELKDSSHKVEFEPLLTEVHGPRVHTSSRASEYRESVAFVLRSLEVTGDVNVSGTLTPTSIEVLPQALSTLSEHRIEDRRHNDNVKLSRRQWYVGTGLLGLAAVTLLFELIKWLRT